MMVRRSGPLPARLHVTEVRLTSLTGGGNSWTLHVAIVDAHGRQATTAPIVLTAANSRWMVLELVPPDPDTLIVPTPPALRPTGPPRARRAALEFTQSFLDYTYGHATARQLRDLTPTLRAAIASNPPQVPAAIRALHPESQASRSHPSTELGWPRPTSPTDRTRTRSSASCTASIATGSPSRCDRQDEPTTG